MMYQFNNKKVKYYAFTLAEVLITLGVIGVVAALTLPAVIVNHKRLESVSRLKKGYTTISQALTRAQVDNGDISVWDSMATDSEADDKDDAKVVKDVQTYILPYLSNVIAAKYGSLRDFGYSPYYTVKGETNTNLSTLNSQAYMILTADSITYFFTRNSSGGLLIYIDTDGNKKRNIWGRDAFIFIIQKNNKFIPLGTSSRENNLRSCKSDGKFCSALIMQDGWQMSKDYPW